MTRSGRSRVGVTPAKAASKVGREMPFDLASGQRSFSSHARNWASILAAEAGERKVMKARNKATKKSRNSFAPPSVLPDISPARGEIGSVDAVGQSPPLRG